MINAEHPSTVQNIIRARYLRRDEIRWANTYMPQQWYAGGPSRPKLQDIVVRAFTEFGVSILLKTNKRPPAGDLGGSIASHRVSRRASSFTTSRPILRRPRPCPGLGLRRRHVAMLGIIDEVNTLELSELQRPEEPAE